MVLQKRRLGVDLPQKKKKNSGEKFDFFCGMLHLLAFGRAFLLWDASFRNSLFCLLAEKLHALRKIHP